MSWEQIVSILRDGGTIAALAVILVLFLRGDLVPRPVWEQQRRGDELLERLVVAFERLVYAYDQLLLLSGDDQVVENGRVQLRKHQAAIAKGKGPGTG